MRLAALICLGLMALTPTASAQTRAVTNPTPAITPLDYLPALRGDYFRIASTATGRPYHIYVRYPEGYDPAAARTYPTIYLLDGDSLFPILAANHLFLTYDDRLPEAIVVGIAYGGFDRETNLRHVDFQSPGEGVTAEQAGAPRFQTFLKTELIPEIERRYRSDPAQRVLFGQSRGGAFVLYSAVSDPDLFRGRIASNPSLTPGFESLVPPAAAAGGELDLVVTSGTRDRADLQAEAARWLALWEEGADRPWRLHGVRIEDGTHAANAPDAYRQGLRLLFGTDGSP